MQLRPDYSRNFHQKKKGGGGGVVESYGDPKKERSFFSDGKEVLCESICPSVSVCFCVCVCVCVIPQSTSKTFVICVKSQ